MMRFKRFQNLWEIAPHKGGGGGGYQAQPTQTTTKTTSEPWKEQKPYLTKGFQGAESDILNNPLQFFQGQTYVDPSRQTLSALNMMENRALQGSPLVGAAQQNMVNTLQGDYLNNPVSGQIADAVMAQVKPSVDATFALQGRSGQSPLAQEALATGISRGIAPYAFNDYRTGRAEQMAAAQGAPGLANQDYYDIGQLAAAGQAQEQISGLPLQEALARHEFEQMEPYQRLGAYMGLIGGNYGGTSSGTTTGQQYLPQQPGFNPLLFGLGAAGTIGSFFL